MGKIISYAIAYNVYGYDLALERRLHERGKLNTLLVPREMQILSKPMYFCGIINASNLPKVALNYNRCCSTYNYYFILEVEGLVLKGTFQHSNQISIPKNHISELCRLRKSLFPLNFDFRHR